MTVYLSTTLGSITPVVVTDAGGATAVLAALHNLGTAKVTASVGDVKQQVEIVFKASTATLYLALVLRDEQPPVLVINY